MPAASPRPEVVERLRELATRWLLTGDTGDDWQTRHDWSTAAERVLAFGDVVGKSSAAYIWALSVRDQQDAPEDARTFGGDQVFLDAIGVAPIGITREPPR